MSLNKIDRDKFWIALSLQAIFWFTFQLGFNLVHTILVKRLGISVLPYAYLLSNAVNMANAVFFILYIDKIPRKTFLKFLCLFQIVFLIAAKILIDRSDETSGMSSSLGASVLLIVLSQSVLITLLTAIWAVTNDFFRPSEARRLYPYLNMGGIVGGFAAGCIVPAFVRFFGVSDLLYLWILSMGAILFLLWMWGNSFNEDAKQGQYQYQVKASLPDLWRYITVSNTVKALVVIVIFLRVVTNVEDFQYTQAMNVSFSSEASLSAYFGYYSLLWSVSAMLLQLFVARKFLMNVGIFRSLFFLPAITGLSFLWLLIDFGFWAGFFLNYSWGMVSLVLNSNAYQLSFNVVPTRVRGKIRGLVDGFASSFGGLVGSLLLLGVNYFFSHHSSFRYELISIIGVTLCTLWIIAVAYGRKHYIRDLVRNLYGENRATILDSLESMEERREPAANKSLLDILHSPKSRFDIEVKSKVMEVLARLGNALSLRSLALFLKNSEGHLRKNAVAALNAFRNLESYPMALHYILNEMQELFRKDPFGPVRLEAGKFLIRHMPSKELPHYILGLLNDPDKYARIAVIEALGKLDLPFSDMLELNLLEDKDPKIRGLALVHLSKYPEYAPQLDSKLRSMLGSDNPEEVKYGLVTLFKLGPQPQHMSDVQKILFSDNPMLKSLAGLTSLELVDDNDPIRGKFLTKIMEALVDPHYEESLREEFVTLVLNLREKNIDELFDNIQQLPAERRLLAQRGLDKIATLLYEKIEEEYSLQL